jgi:hypothetical protein
MELSEAKKSPYSTQSEHPDVGANFEEELMQINLLHSSQTVYLGKFEVSRRDADIINRNHFPRPLTPGRLWHPDPPKRTLNRPNDKSEPW